MGNKCSRHILFQTEEFLKYACSRKYSASTIRQYDLTLRKLVSFLETRKICRLQDVGREDLEAFCRHLKDKNLSLGSMENDMRATRMFFRWMESSGQLFADPAVGLEMPKRTRGLLIVPAEDEMSKLLEQPDIKKPIGIRDRALMEIAYGCGLRRTELSKLSIHDVNAEQSMLRVHGKGGKERMVPLGKQALHWLTVYLNEARPKLLKNRVDEERLWISTQRTAMDGCSIYLKIRNYVNSAGIKTPMNLHSLRKACASHMLSHGAHPVQIQNLLGHSSMRHMGKYLSVTIQDMKKTHSQSKLGN